MSAKTRLLKTVLVLRNGSLSKLTGRSSTGMVGGLERSRLVVVFVTLKSRNCCSTEAPLSSRPKTAPLPGAGPSPRFRHHSNGHWPPTALVQTAESVPKKLLVTGELGGSFVSAGAPTIADSAGLPTNRLVTQYDPPCNAPAGSQRWKKWFE